VCAIGYAEVFTTSVTTTTQSVSTPKWNNVTLKATEEESITNPGEYSKHLVYYTYKSRSRDTIFVDIHVMTEHKKPLSVFYWACYIAFTSHVKIRITKRKPRTKSEGEDREFSVAAVVDRIST